MPIIFGGTTVEKVVFGGTEVDKVVFNGVTVFESKPQLATPQNVTADGTNVSWDEVENATSYEVIEGGNNVLGTVTPTPAVSKNWKFNGTKTAVPQQSFTKKASINGKSYNDSTFVEDFVGIYADADWSYIAFGSAGYWDTSNNTWGAANILKFNDEPSGDLLVFLKAHAQAID